MSGFDLDFYGGIDNSGSYSGTLSAKNYINLSRDSRTSTSIFAGKYITAYDQPASLANLAGTYAGYGLTGKTSTQAVTVTIGSTKQVVVLALNASKTDGFIYAGMR